MLVAVSLIETAVNFTAAFTI